ncbi:hypothetical protein BN873_150020 [Candidatus Competibacter denitrificans Run_A_D11]|uniref:Uncharacterized protein n=1 Tax=Candidatus Competibacter denitrificans Run_A_D11 TaxID=1400863 RepID=W6M1C0_9GAMM|nr:hypothetical protein BN873_150020 [Candidatus Competibacter denitrificans Run_A_D11]
MGAADFWEVGQKKACRNASLDIGAGKRNRTSDLLITNQLLYRLSYSGEIYEVGKSNQFKFEIQVKVKSIA